MDKESILAVTVDVEDWYHIPSVTGSAFSKYETVGKFFKDWTGRYDYLTQPTYKILELFDQLGIKATFFVVADVVDYYPGLVEKIAENGHEIACHGLHHACKIDPRTKTPRFSQSEFEKRTLYAKTKLQEATGKEVIGFRAPNALIAGWMLDSLEKLGFRYDSSVAVNSLYCKMPSIPKNVATVPYYPKPGRLDKDKSIRQILEIPWPYWHIVGAKLPTAGGPFLRFFGAQYIIRGLQQSLQAGDSVFYFHPIDICEERFPNGFSSKRPFYWSIKGPTVKKNIERILNHFQGQLGTCQDILAKYTIDRMA